MELREQLRNEIEDTRTTFHRLLDSLPDQAFSLPSGNLAWTIGEVLYHMSLAPRFLISDVRIITSQGWLISLIPILLPAKLFNWLNKELTRYGARKLSRQFLAQEYDRATASTLQALDSVSDDDFDLRVFYPDWDPMLCGEMTLERLLHYVKNHFDTHTAQISQVVSHKI